MSTNNHQDKLIPIFAQLTAAVLQQGLDYSRRDDPHAYRIATDLLKQAGHRFELRIVLGPGDELFRTRGLITDEHGEGLVEVFQIVAGDAHHV